jgi:hypothetical protein
VASWPESAHTLSLDLGHQFDSLGAVAADAEKYGAATQFE